jgi:hypothetical protein
MTCSIQRGPQETFDVSGSAALDDVNRASYEGRVVMTRTQDSLSVEVGGIPIINAAQGTAVAMDFKNLVSDEIYQIITGANSEQVINCTISFAFNTITIALFYKNNMEQIRVFVYRTVLEGILQDKCLAITTDKTTNGQIEMAYTLPSFTDIAMALNF